MERIIGETFEFENKKIEVKEVEKNICSNCFFNGMCIGKRIDICGECYGKWRSDGKNVIFVEMQEPKKEKFDPNTLQPFDKVLVRDSYDYIWVCDLFSNIIGDIVEYKYRCIGSSYKYCIPYNNDTKRILGTFHLPPEYYIYWEDYPKME